MSRHGIEKCEHGTTVRQCRCIGPHEITIVACPPHCPLRGLQAVLPTPAIELSFSDRKDLTEFFEERRGDALKGLSGSDLPRAERAIEEAKRYDGIVAVLKSFHNNEHDSVTLTRQGPRAT